MKLYGCMKSVQTVLNAYAERYRYINWLAEQLKPSGPQADKLRKDITKCFKDHGLKITIKTNLKIVNFLDVTFNLSSGTYYPYIKPNDTPLYINTKSNHPPSIIRQLPESISRRLFDLSCSKDAFEKAKPPYEAALQASGYRDKLTYVSNPASRRKRNS